MACIRPDGKPTESGTKMLRALKSGLGSPEEIASNTGLPLFRVRSGLRELTQAGLAIEKDGKHELTEKGAKLIG
jgi:predicted transcriptional regulator